MSTTASFGVKKLGGVVLAVFFMVSCEFGNNEPKLSPERVSVGTLQNPSDIVRWKGKLVVTELYTERLAILDNVDDRQPVYLSELETGKRFNAPHNLAVSKNDTLLISNGWGKSIVEIQDLEGAGWKSFSGIGKGFNAPHGICTDNQGWIYVADSLNFRIVRFRDMNGTDWQEFRDIDKKIGYVRQLVCNEEGLWAANGYEKEEGRKRGTGGNILLIRDFQSGKVEEIAATHSSKITGILPLRDHVIAAVWRPVPNIRIYSRKDREDVTEFQVTPPELGIPYAMYLDPQTGMLLQTYFGSLKDQGRKNQGGVLELTLKQP